MRKCHELRLVADELKVDGVERGLLADERGVNACAVDVADQNEADEPVVARHEQLVVLVVLLEIGLAVIGAGGDHVQTHEARSVHRDGLGERADMVCHIFACGLALHIGVRQDGEDAVHALAGNFAVGEFTDLTAFRNKFLEFHNLLRFRTFIAKIVKKQYLC